MFKKICRFVNDILQKISLVIRFLPPHKNQPFMLSSIKVLNIRTPMSSALSSMSKVV